MRVRGLGGIQSWPQPDFFVRQCFDGELHAGSHAESDTDFFRDLHPSKLVERYLSHFAHSGVFLLEFLSLSFRLLYLLAIPQVGGASA